MPHEILHLLGPAMRKGAGIARTVAWLAARLDSDRYRIHAWFLEGDGPLVQELEANRVQVRVVLWRGGKWDPLGAYRFWRALRSEKFALIHQHSGGGRSARFLIRAIGGPKILQHVRASTVEGRGIRAPLSTFCADRVIAVSHAVARDVVGKLAQVVYTGLPIDEARGSEAPIESPAGKLTIVGTACRLVRVKAVDILVRAIAAMRDEFPGLRLEIAGEGPEQDRLEALVRAYRLADRVTFLGWQDQVTPVMRRWAVFALPSLDEGLGNVLLEAMAASLPVVASRCGGIPEVVEEGRTGWLVPPNDPSALAERLRALLLDSSQRRAMGLAGRARVREHFSVDRMVREIAQIYDEMIEEAPFRRAG